MIILIVVLAAACVAALVPVFRRTRADSRSVAAFSRTCHALRPPHDAAGGSDGIALEPRAHIRVVATCPRSGQPRAVRPRLSVPAPPPQTVIVLGHGTRLSDFGQRPMIGASGVNPGGANPHSETATAGRAEAGRV